MDYIKVLTGGYARIEFNNRHYYGQRSGEQIKRDLEEDMRELRMFLSDHRQLDTRVSMVNEYSYVCPHCKTQYPTDEQKPKCCNLARITWDYAWLVDLVSEDEEWRPYLTTFEKS